MVVPQITSLDATCVWTGFGRMAVARATPRHMEKQCMSAQNSMQRQTYEVVTQWFGALAKGEIDTAMACLDDNVEWTSAVSVFGAASVVPWIGSYQSRQQVVATFQSFASMVEVVNEELLHLVVQGDMAVGIVTEQAMVKATGRSFEVEFAQQMTMRDGKIVRWKSYCDPSAILAALA